MNASRGGLRSRVRRRITLRPLRAVYIARVNITPTAGLTLLAFAAAACASGSSSAPARASGPAGDIARACPGPADGPSIVVGAIESAHRALTTNPAAALPPACVVTALAHLQTSIADSTREHALTVAGELGRRGPAHPDLVASEVMLLSRLERHADVSRAYDRLIALDSAPSMDIVRLALGAARQRGDTATLTRVLNRAATRSGAPVAMRTEQSVLRSVPALWSAVNQAKGFLRQNPRMAVQYPSIVANFGTLALPDSVAAYARQGLANGATRASLTPSIESFVTTVQRHASLYASTYEWDRVITGVMRVDSALSTPSTKFLLASLSVQSVGPVVDAAGVQLSGESSRVAGCRRLLGASSRLDAAEMHLSAGGDRHTASAVSALRGAMTSARSRIVALREPCGRA